MTDWWDGRLMALDLETTSADPEEARIVSIAVVLVGGGQETETWVRLVDPGVEIPAEATAIHGVSTERARAEGMPSEIGAAWALGWLTSAVQKQWPVVAMNARYDLTVVDRDLRRHGLPPLDAIDGTIAVASRPLIVIDPLVIDKHLDRYRPGSRKLGAICGHYGATLDMAHDAAFDAIAAARAAWVIGKRGRLVRRVRDEQEARELAELRVEWDDVRRDLAKLHAAQVRWAADQARGLEEHFARKGEPERVETAWPVVPVAVEARA